MLKGQIAFRVQRARQLHKRTRACKNLKGGLGNTARHQPDVCVGPFCRAGRGAGTLGALADWGPVCGCNGQGHTSGIHYMSQSAGNAYARVASAGMTLGFAVRLAAAPE